MPAAPLASPLPAAASFDAVTKVAAETLRGELRCSFSVAGKTLLIGAANVGGANRATAVVVQAGTARSLESSARGGFDALGKGGAFTGDGLTATVVRGARDQLTMRARSIARR